MITGGGRKEEVLETCAEYTGIKRKQVPQVEGCATVLQQPRDRGVMTLTLRRIEVDKSHLHTR